METSSVLSLASTLTLSCPTPDENRKTPPPSTLEDITPHDEFWFQDGNVVLVAGDVGFRVYRGLLSAQSTVFSDMFSCACEDGEETFEGCPIVRLSDTPQELAYLLRILLPKSWRRSHPAKGKQKLAFEEVAAQARLSHKYHIPDVEEQALDLLRERYTHSFDEWTTGKKSESISADRVHAIGAVNIARLTDATSMLPSALYTCCNLGPDLLSGWKREDGRVEHLSVDDLKICFAARETLCKEGAQIFFKIFHDQPSAECLSGDKCRAALGEMTKALVKCSLSLAIECSVLQSWKTIITIKAASHGVCVRCKKELLARDRKARMEVWDKLPGIFGVSVSGWGKKPEDGSVAA
ncbi:hypothetical protein GSI_12311 [Ganoderma sinense ZZ0214-1]|uniref:BTB domain-containing protein n=1 Tax=Ganoderma sinense ZZ0214-1 TaxID=1077348 RepID=A0A2G8RYF5_9APHY|nr:hypothetical protein GSI_12311 [Ganoderma sinense ZZ0214-1]